MTTSYEVTRDGDKFGFIAYRFGRIVWIDEQGYDSEETARAAATAFCIGMHCEHMEWEKTQNDFYERLPILPNNLN